MIMMDHTYPVFGAISSLHQQIIIGYLVGLAFHLKQKAQLAIWCLTNEMWIGKLSDKGVKDLTRLED